MEQKTPSGPSLFLQKYTDYVDKWTWIQTSLLGSSILFFMIAIICLFIGKEGISAIGLTIGFISFFVLYSLSYTIKELFLMKSLQCKQAIEPFYNLEKENSLYDCIDQYYSLATAARKKAFRYESDSDTSIPAYYDRIRRFFYWKEYHILEEVCLLSAIDLFTKQVRSTPCDVHLHARLANAYILLQNHFVEPMKAKKLMAWPSLFLTSHTKEEYQNKADKASRLAVTELDITSAFAPDEMWVHEQLAISYHELKMSQKEIEECEKLFQANSEDPHVLLRLGTLYFQSGQNGSGLKMYGLLKEIDPRLGQELISQYGSYTPFLEKNAL